MPVAGQKVRGKATRPWFEDGKIQKVVGRAVVAEMHVRDYLKTKAFKATKITLTKKEEKQAIEMYDEWRGEVAVKVREALDQSGGIGLGRRY